MSIITWFICGTMIASFLLNHIVDFMFASSEIFIGACFVCLILSSFTPFCEIIITYFKASLDHTRNRPLENNSETIHDEDMMKLVTYHYGEQDQPHEHILPGKRNEKMIPSEPKLNVSSKPNLEGIAIICGFLSVSFLLNNITYSLILSLHIFAGTCLVHIILCSFTPFREIVAAHFAKPNYPKVIRINHTKEPIRKNMGFINTLANLCSTQVSFLNLSILNYRDPEKPEESEGARNPEGRIDEINQNLPKMEENLITESAQNQEHSEQSTDQPELERIGKKIDELPVLLKENKSTEQTATNYGTSVSDSESDGKQGMPDDNPQIVTAPELDAEINKISKVSITPVVETLEVVSSEVSLPAPDKMIKEIPVVIASAQKEVPEMSVTQVREVGIKEIPLEEVQIITNTEERFENVELTSLGEIQGQNTAQGREVEEVELTSQGDVKGQNTAQGRDVELTSLGDVKGQNTAQGRDVKDVELTSLGDVKGQNTAEGREVENGDDATIFVNLDSDEFSDSESASVSTLDDHIEVVKSCKPVYEPFTEVHVAPPSELFLNDVITQLDQEIKVIADHEKRAKSVIEEKEKKEEQDQEYEVTKQIQYRLMKQIHILDYQKRQYEIQERENILSPETTVVSVPAFTLKSMNSQKFATYIIMVQRKTEDGRLKSGWILSHRYNEFFELYQYLRKKQLCRFDFPGKTLFATLDDDLLEFRRAKFNELLQILISKPKVCGDVEFRKFLHK